MTISRILCVCCAIVSLMAPGFCGDADSATKNKVPGENSSAKLVIVQDIVVQSEVAGLFVLPVECDGDGDVYMRKDIETTSGIIKVDPKGKKRVATFASSSVTDHPIGHAGYFAVESDGNVQQLASLNGSLDRVVIKFNKDGSYKSSVKLDPPPGFEDWFPTQLAVFGNGDLLVAGFKQGKETQQVRIPFTGIYDSNGKLKKELALVDDDDIKKMGEAQDRRVTDAVHPFENRAIELGMMEPGGDGNLYLMRRLSPAIVYAISPAGEVVRRFTVDSGEPDYMPFDIHIAGGRAAVLFYEPQSDKELLKIVDLEGNNLATYREAEEKDSQRTIGAFACYAQNPERFTFLYTTDEHSLGLHIVEPR